MSLLAAEVVFPPAASPASISGKGAALAFSNSLLLTASSPRGFGLGEWEVVFAAPFEVVASLEFVHGSQCQNFTSQHQDICLICARFTITDIC